MPLLVPCTGTVQGVHSARANIGLREIGVAGQEKERKFRTFASFATTTTSIEKTHTYSQVLATTKVTIIDPFSEARPLFRFAVLQDDPFIYHTP